MAYEVILLDQGRTFMFENDRFGPKEDYYATYLRAGGSALAEGMVRGVMDKVYARMRELYSDLAQSECFPRASELVKRMDLLGPAVSETNAEGNLEVEAARFDTIFALQEVGTISETHAAALKALSRTHRLGIVSNIWGDKAPFEANLRSAGVFDCFEHIVWSSDQDGSVKPSPRLFQLALNHFRVPPDRVLFVGDDPVRDIHPAKSLGLGAAWINHGASEREYPANLRRPDIELSDLAELPPLLSCGKAQAQGQGKQLP